MRLPDVPVAAGHGHVGLVEAERGGAGHGGEVHVAVDEAWAEVATVEIDLDDVGRRREDGIGVAARGLDRVNEPVAQHDGLAGDDAAIGGVDNIGVV
ncbi:hypothetical protein BBAD15_g6984 [Beauveria bassiana D1-5]|uniref:Uncharacterized protein n=1 Tax=Beauveria bassiana D1-5 TaxID=1245745 RepID=A0A0A2VNJ5_BEABA|nr:hypothetical protein BBAD15_g6984 [Beauveria bassiana D1-5]